MNYIQSLFIRDDQNPFENTFGWFSPHYHLMSWALSCLSIREQLGSVSLFCNRKAKELLIDVLNLPYDEVHETMEGWNPPHPQLWALSKIHTYSLQKKPFLHIDGDVYLFEKLPDRIKSAEIAAQNIEEFTDYYYSFMGPINRKFTYKPDCVIEDFEKQENLHALNAGILGGCNIDFFQRYTAEAFKYVDANIQSLNKIDANRFNVFFEQHLCYKMADEANLKVEYLLPQSYRDNSYLGLDKFHDIQSKQTTYFHLLGNYKADEFTCQQMAKTLHGLYPHYYYKIISLFPALVREHQDINDKIECQNSFKKGKYLIEKRVENNSSKYFNWTPNGMQSLHEIDFKSFKEQVNKFLTIRKNYSLAYLDERDYSSHKWYYDIFNNRKKIQCSPVIHVIHSKYDWGKIYRSSKTSGIAYYNDTSSNDLIAASYYSLLVSELSPEGFSLFDIDEFEVIILNHTKIPISIHSLIEKLYQYVDEEVRLNYADKFKALVYESLKRLILAKAIMPI